MAERWAPPEARVVDDPYAEALGERHLVVWAIRGMRHLVPPLGRTVDELRTAHCVRHAAIDALLLRAIEAGARQVVILGAGYDMRAARFARPGLRWFEVDRPGILGRKERAGPVEVGRVPFELGAPGLGDALAAAGWARGESTVFVIEGVVHYLPRAELDLVLADLVPGGPREVLLSFIRAGMVRRASTTLNHLFRAMREIPRTWYEPADIARIGAEVGLERCQVWDFEAQVRELVPRAAGRPVGVSQEVARLYGSGPGPTTGQPPSPSTSPSRPGRAC